MSNFLNQNEIDALLNSNYAQEETLTPEELDALGEVANISMGSGATALSELVNQTVVITNPQVLQISLEEFINQLPKPHLAIRVEFISGLIGDNLLIISNRDAGVLANMMMGEDPEDEAEYLDEIHISAASEAMNQMVASAATAMSQVFKRTVNISPPDIKPFDQEVVDDLISKTKLVVIKFQMTVGDFLHSELFQMLPVETAREQARLLFDTNDMEQSSARKEDYLNSGKIQEPIKKQTDTEVIGYTESDIPSSIVSDSLGLSSESNIDLILDIPLTVSVVLGRTKKPIQDILMYQSGSIVELNRLIDENVDIMVNNILVAKGEVVVINDNFGVRITNIMNPGERINQLKSETLI